MAQIFEAETDYGKIRIVESMANFDGFIEKAWRLYHIYETRKSGFFRVNECIISENYAKSLIVKHNLKRIK